MAHPTVDAARASVPLTTNTNGQMQQSLWRRILGWERDNGIEASSEPAHKADAVDQQRDTRTGIIRRVSRKVVPGLPRTQTFKRQRSEVRSRLEPVRPTPAERRAVSMDRRVHASNSALDHCDPRTSAPDFLHHCLSAPQSPPSYPMSPLEGIDTIGDLDGFDLERDPSDDGFVHDVDALSRLDVQSMTTSQYDALIESELERKWILNLSMHFRDKSKREKFFVTFRQHEHTWRRVTISLDYRNAPENSLEADLAGTQYQRDKSAKIYEAIRDSLAEIEFYNTVTNLKLETKEGRLHVHVVEDANEIINYPPIRMVQHMNCWRVKEREIHFDSHMSGFVYKVRVHGRLLIKKEIPGPDTVDEFLYEINALNQLYDAKHVIQFYGIVVDDTEEHVTGLLISYAARGALIDVIYDSDHSLPWPTREKWARQIIGGLSEIHEAGFVQGDFTLSNIVIDENDDAKIIDINRRGCPIGWEPPEATPLIESNQRISMYIGVKSDLYQLGMVLWALATQEDEPDAFGRPLKIDPEIQVPAWYRRVVDTCLSINPKKRVQALQLLSWFPDAEDGAQNGRPNGSVNGDDRSRHDYVSPAGVPRIKTVHPPSDWAYVGWGSQHPADEPFCYPSRGRSPPSPMPSNQGDYDPARYGRRMCTWSDSLNRAPTVPSVSDVLARDPRGESATEPTASGETLETYADGRYGRRGAATNASKDDGRGTGRDYIEGNGQPMEDEADQHQLTTTWAAHSNNWRFGEEQDRLTSNAGSRSREPGNKGNTAPNSRDSGKDVTELASTPRDHRVYSPGSRERSVSRGRRRSRSSSVSAPHRNGQQVDTMTTETHEQPLDGEVEHRHDSDEQQYEASHRSSLATATTDAGNTGTGGGFSAGRGRADDVLKGIGSVHGQAHLDLNDSHEHDETRQRQRQHDIILDEDLGSELDLDRSLREALVGANGKVRA